MSLRYGLLVFTLVLFGAMPGHAQWDGMAKKVPVMVTVDSTVANRDSLTSRDSLPATVPESASVAAPAPSPTQAELKTPSKAELRALAREAKQSEAWQHSASSGFQVYRLGNAAACAGLGIAAVGVLYDLPLMWVGGAITAEFGIPIAGLGASKSNRASKRLAKTRNQKGGYAWPANFAGWGLLVGSVFALSSDMEEHIDPVSGDTIREPTKNARDLSRMVALSGLAAHALSWYGFSKKVEGARENLSRVALVPKLEKDRHGISGAGLSLALSF